MTEKYTKLTINDLPKDIPDFKNSNLSKDRLTEKWLTEWIIKSLQIKNINVGDILPRKDIIAKHLGISIGTVQNAIRYTEDKGFLKSKQRTGTAIANFKSFTGKSNEIKKQTSKRDVTVEKIKKYMIDNGINSVMPAASVIAKKINVSANTVRLAYLYLCDTGFLEYSTGKSGKKMLTVATIPDTPIDYSATHLSLVGKTVNDLSDYISENFKKGDRLQTRAELAKILNISIKTVHDAVNILEKKGILISRRGKYGTTVLKMPKDAELFHPLRERSIFAKADEAAFYRWEKIENQISKLIQEEYDIGMKLPSMSILAEKFNVSTNTIRKALKRLSEQNYIKLERGRYGGTFIMDIPENDIHNTYEWLAITPEFLSTQKVK